MPTVSMSVGIFIFIKFQANKDFRFAPLDSEHKELYY